MSCRVMFGEVHARKELRERAASTSEQTPSLSHVSSPLLMPQNNGTLPHDPRGRPMETAVYTAVKYNDMR